MTEIRPLRPMGGHLVSHHGESCLIASSEAFIANGTQGFYYRLTRFLSHWRFSVDGQMPQLVAATETGSYASIAYYLAPTPAGKAAGPEPDSNHDDDEIIKKGIEIQVNRLVGGGFCDAMLVTNRALAPTSLVLRWEIDADFADYSEAAAGKRQQTARVTREWQHCEDGGTLLLRYDHPDLPHATQIRFGGDGRFTCDNGKVSCELYLECQRAARLILHVEVVFCDDWVEPLYAPDADEIRPTAALRRQALELVTPNRLVQVAWNRALADLTGLALLDGSRDENLTPAAGIPKYDALFGRDVLVAAFQSGWVDPEMLRGSLRKVARWNATDYDDRFDAEPGRVIHQRQQSPLALLKKNPFLHYYGDYSAPGWFLIDIAWDFLLTDDREFLRSMRDTALATLAWMDRDGDRDHDGFYEYATKAGSWGEKNQGWKDSRDAILYEDGRMVQNPIALVEIQGCYCCAKQLIALAFAAIGDQDRAVALWDAARRLKLQFNRAFWLADEQYYAVALDPEKRPVPSITPDAGQCLAYGIVADEYSIQLVQRLMKPDLFTGWGLRTLSSHHPAFNPFSYHLGSVWPVANAMIGFGLKRYGFNAELHRLAQSLFEASELFDRNRLPEVFGGHARDRAHPHPGIYPKANAPQAWSASAILNIVQAMLGIVPAAPWRMLIVDPDLPEWLPEITVSDIRVGDGVAAIRFWRDGDGATRHEVRKSSRGLRIHRPPPRPRGVDGLSATLQALMAQG